MNNIHNTHMDKITKNINKIEQKVIQKIDKIL